MLDRAYRKAVAVQHIGVHGLRDGESSIRIERVDREIIHQVGVHGIRETREYGFTSKNSRRG